MMAYINCSKSLSGNHNFNPSGECYYYGYLEELVPIELKTTDMLLNRDEASTILKIIYHSYIPYDTPEGIKMHKLITRLEEFLE